MVKEKRRERRIKIRLPIRISYPGSQEIHSQTENISRLGTYVELEQAIPLGMHLDITIEIPGYTHNLSLIGSVRCRGDVFRCSLAREVGSVMLYGLGIFFTDFYSEEDRNRLSGYIDFLILKEQEDIKQAIQRWGKKRRKRRGQKKS